MTTSNEFTAQIAEMGGARPRTFKIARMFNLGSATRRADHAITHQEEVAKAGIRIDFSIPAPRIYPIAPWALVTDDELLVHGERTSGEVEIVLVVADRLYVGVGSDHTDRDLERVSIPWSKQACANVLAPVLWPFDDVADHWDECVLSSWVDGKPYQSNRVDFFIAPRDLLRLLGERLGAPPAGDFVVFCGTAAAIDKELGFGRQWSIQLEDPILRRSIRHDYQVVRMAEEIRPAFRVPLVTGKI